MQCLDNYQKTTTALLQFWAIFCTKFQSFGGYMKMFSGILLRQSHLRAHFQGLKYHTFVYVCVCRIRVAVFRHPQVVYVNVTNNTETIWLSQQCYLVHCSNTLVNLTKFIYCIFPQICNCDRTMK